LKIFQTSNNIKKNPGKKPVHLTGEPLAGFVFPKNSYFFFSEIQMHSFCFCISTARVILTHFSFKIKPKNVFVLKLVYHKRKTKKTTCPQPIFQKFTPHTNSIFDINNMTKKR
jgi:hypothetical protein